MVHTLGGAGTTQPEITRGSLIPTLWVSHRSFVDMGGEMCHWLGHGGWVCSDPP